MKFKANRQLEFSKDEGWADYGIIPKETLCDSKPWGIGGYNTIFYNGIPVCDVESELGKECFDEIKIPRKYTIYAVDFDGTICESIFPGKGKPNMALINHLIKRRKQGNKIILWTCRVGDSLNEAVEWCRQFGLEFDTVNENLPEMVEYWGGESRKVFADVYIDDKAVNKPKYHVPYKEVAE